MAVTLAGGGAALGVATEQDIAEPPNVLIIVTDDQRVDTMEVMPNVRRYFGSEGMELTDAYATTPLCCPSRASIFTGLYMHNHGVEANAEDAVQSLEGRSTLQYYLDRAGYRTGIFGKYFNFWPLDINPGYWDEWAITNWKYTDSMFNIQGRQRRVGKYVTHFISDRADRFIRTNAASGGPWFAYVAPTAPHEPFEPEEAHERARVSKWAGNPAVAEETRTDKPPDVQKFSTTPGEARRIRRQQLRTLMSVDDMVGRLMKTLEKTGEDDNTIAIFLSDNGYFWGEHGLRDKRLPYRQAIRIPLFVRWPGLVVGGFRDGRMAANIDVAPTVLDATGIEPDHVIDGRSLLQDWDRNRLLIEYGKDAPPLDIVPNWAGVLTDQFQYVEYYNRSNERVFREYYDLFDDPWQLDNVLADDDPANDPSAADLHSLSTQLLVDRRCTGSDCP